MKKKYFAILLSLVMASAALLAACGTPNPDDTDPPDTGDPPVEEPTPKPEPEQIPLDTEHGIADQSYLYGMCYLMEERNGHWNTALADEAIKTDAELLGNLGTKTVRHWMHFTALMRDKDTMNEENCAQMHTMLQACSERGIVNIGMNHSNFNRYGAATGKLKRNMVPNSDYIRWLDDYYTSWYNLVTEFPEVTYWEVDNELNNYDFMYNAADGSHFTPIEMAAVATDILYYATRAIHDANPEAKSVMGGLTEPMSLGNSNLEAGRPSNAWFLQAIYDNIASGEYGYFYSTESDITASLDPDDYFDILSWHPYVWDTKPLDEDFFVTENAKTYQVVLDNEGKHKKVFLSEVGFTDYSRGETVVAQSVINLFHAVSERMPYVETVNLFKMYDVGTAAWSSTPDGADHYGFFYDPDPSRVYYPIDESRPTQTTSDRCTPGAPKKVAFAFQSLAGGSGSLELAMECVAKNA